MFHFKKEPTSNRTYQRLT